MEGRFLHINQGELYVYSPDGGIKGMDTIRIEAGRFAYQTPMEKASTLILVFPNFSQHPVFAEPGASVDIKADASHLKEMTVKGTEDNKLMNTFREQIATASPLEEVKAAETFINDHPGSRVSLYLLQRYFVNVPDVDTKKGLRLIAVMESAKKSDVEPANLARQKQYLTGIKNTTVGATLPTFTAKDIDGKNVGSTDLKQGIAVISTWASWSYGSMDIQRSLRDISKDHDNLKLLGICLDGSKEECRKTAESNKLSGTMVCDELLLEGSLYRLLGFSSVPDNIILRNGKIIKRGLDNKTLKEQLNNLLK